MMITVSAEVMNSPARVKLVQDVLKVTDHFTNKHNIQMLFQDALYPGY